MASQKYYAVKKGRISGIYTSWDDCKKQVQGFSGALYKSFNSVDEANAYMSKEAIIAANDLPASVGKHYDIYVDGCYINNNYSWAFVVYDGFAVIYQNSGLGQSAEAALTRNVAGELEATMNAVAWAMSQDIAFITIHHDYIGISEWALGNWKANNPVTKYYVQFITPHLHRVRFNKVSAHSGVKGNELADKLAKQAFLGQNCLQYLEWSVHYECQGGWINSS